MGHPVTYLKDYTPPPFLVDEVALTFHLDPSQTRVLARMKLRRNPDGVDGESLELVGGGLNLKSVHMDGRALSPSDYTATPDQLTLQRVPEAFELELETRIDPAGNSSLEGLYYVNGLFCTQCEAEGFRKITYYPDRPDVLARFTTTVIAPKKSAPILLSNGNPIEEGELNGERHFVTWEDPFPKPAYLFALVAGDLFCARDQFTTRSGRQVDLRLYVDPENHQKCDHALESLKKSMTWEEERFGREYDLDIYMIVAVNDFNMGAMENKGLNVFNAKYVLAHPQTATDKDYEYIESVIAHEYLHNWTGNRITCRDWFQLSLKEGLTVFRDQIFSQELSSGPAGRIEDVRLLRSHQFPEDAGPTAHPVRPDAYMEINNFYTVTVYNKGAEVVGMVRTLLGWEGFRKGMDLYFERHDGQAVTVEAFLQAMADATGRDLDQFSRWYSQAGTPELEISSKHDAKSQTLTLTVDQSCPPTPGQPEKASFHIPLAMGLLDRQGTPMPLQLQGEAQPTGTSRVLELRKERETFTFQGIPTPVVPSLLRGFSAPVRLKSDLSEEELTFLWSRDPDPFNRWEVGQELMTRMVLGLASDHEREAFPPIPSAFIEAFGRTLTDDQLDKSLIALALTLPAEKYLLSLMPEGSGHPEAIHRARNHVRRQLAQQLTDPLLASYHANTTPQPYRYDASLTGQRSLKNLCLDLLLVLEHESFRQLAMTQFQQADNMTDALGALTPLVHHGTQEGEAGLAVFHDRWQADPLVLDKWFTIQATSPQAGTLQRVQALFSHPAFTLKNPNRVRALIGAFCGGNPVRFHTPSGSGYRFLTEQILTIDPLNPQVAASLCKSISNWRQFEPQRQRGMRAALQQLSERPNLSRGVVEIIQKSLA
ncbi:MAG: aminopeptidase N [Magnetococcales bacterium]|nr:aminopeptidase N [Magnetococcales bacterium]